MVSTMVGENPPWFSWWVSKPSWRQCERRGLAHASPPPPPSRDRDSDNSGIVTTQRDSDNPPNATRIKRGRGGKELRTVLPCIHMDVNETQSLSWFSFSIWKTQMISVKTQFLQPKFNGLHGGGRRGGGTPFFARALFTASEALTYAEAAAAAAGGRQAAAATATAAAEELVSAALALARRRPPPPRFSFKVQFFTACLGLLESAHTRPFDSLESRIMVRGANFPYFDISSQDWFVKLSFFKAK